MESQQTEPDISTPGKHAAAQTRGLSPGAWSAVVAVIGLVGTIVVALIARGPSEVPRTEIPAATLTPARVLSVRIEGSVRAPLGKRTTFAIISEGATRLVWSIEGFSANDTVVDNPAPRHDIWIEPSNAGRVGSEYIVNVTATDPAGNTRSDTHAFVLVAE
jgi:hypothetical protein